MLATSFFVRRMTAGRSFSALRRASFAALLLVCSLFATSAFAQITGTKNIPGDYATLDAAITDLNTQGTAAPGVTLNLVAANPQTAPIGGYAITTLTGAVGAPIVIQGNGNTITAPTPQASGALNDAIFKIIGTDYVTLDGFTMLENAANTTIAAGTNNMTEWGVALLYASTTDGAQNLNIKNNTITLNRTYQNTFGIYSNSTHSNAVVTTSASATGAAGSNSNLKIYSNTISNVNIGILVVGPTAAADQNDGVDIGGIAAGTGNTITNFGTTGTFSGYANVSGTVNGILVRNTKILNVSYNSVTSSSGATGVTAGTLRGIFIVAGSTQPIGTFTNNINNNTLALTSHVLAGTLQGISVESGASSATSTTNINANNFTALNHTIAAASGATTAIIQAGGATAGPLVTSVSNNNFTNITASSTGAFTFLSNSFTAPTNGTKNVNSNAIVTGFNRTGASGAVTFFTDNGSDTAGTTNNFNNNSFTNVTLAGTSSVAGISSTNGGAPTKNVNGNTVNGISGATGAIIAIQTGFDSGPTSVSGNTVSNVTGGGAVTGLQLASGTGVRTVSRNSIRDLTGSAAGSVVNGIAITSASASSNITLSNNLIGNLTAPTATSSNGVIGVNITGLATTSNFNVFYNTIYLNNATSGVGFGSSGISTLSSATASTSTLNLRNNVIVNNSVQNGAGLTVAYRRSTGAAGTLANYANASNNNAFYAGTPGASNLIYFDGTSSAQTIAAYKSTAFAAGTIAPRDSSSVSENPPFISTVGSSPNFLHISTATPTQLESGAAPIAGITDDFDVETRNSITPDIGADEFSGMVLDLTPPNISYSPLLNTNSTGARTLTATITDATGVQTAGTGLPVLYWRINAGSYAPATATSLGGGQYQFSFGAGVMLADVVSYYVAAQDTAPSQNVGTNPAAGAGGFSANPPAAATPPTSPNSYAIVGSVAGSLSVGTAEPFTSLTRNDAQGIFKFLNDNAVTGNVVINVTSDLLIEDGAVALNEFAAPFTVTIKPSGGARNITGSAATAMIRLNGASRVTFDGSTSGGTDRSLTIENTSVTTPGVFRLGSIGTTPIVANTIKNCTIRNGVNTSSALVVSDTGGALGAYFNNLTIQNNDIQKAFRGMFIDAVATGTNGSGLLITGNSLNTAGVNSIRLNPIFVRGANGVTISNNTLGNISDANLEVPVGILVSTGTDNAVISGNTVSSIVSTNTGASSVSGILISAGATATNIAVSNNTISTLTSAGTAAAFYAIASFTPNVAISDNVISGMSQTGNSSGLGIVLVGVNNNVVSGNSVSAMTVSGSNSVTSGIQAQGASTNVIIERNKVFNMKNTNTGGWGANGIQLASTSLVANTTVRNNFVHDVAAFGFAGSGAGDNGYGMVVTAGAGYNIYANSVLMSTDQTATTGLPAAFNVTNGVTAAGAVNVRNNLFVNTQTVGVQRYSIYSAAPNTVFAAIDFNDYVSAGPNLGFIAGDRATLADIVTGFGGNAASISVDPLFVSATDLHLQPASPAESTGTPIGAVTNDIDGDPRPATKPDIGADELVSNLTIAPTTVTFGNQAVGTTSAEMSVTLSNTGAGSLDVTTLTAAATPFARTATGTCSATPPITIAAGGSCTLTYTFAPTVAAFATQTLTVTSNGPGSGSITLTGTGTQGNLTITPTSVPFGDQTVGTTSAEMIVTLANTGNGSLDVTALTAAAAPFARTGTGSCSASLPITIAASSSCTLTYTFAPSVTGAANQTLTVTANAPGSGTIALSGNGVQGTLTITPNSINFGTQTVNTTTAESTVTLANTGNVSLDVTTLTAAAAPFARTGTGTCSQMLPITIAPAASCTLTYTFTPTVTGPAGQTLTVTSSGAGSGTITLAGTGAGAGGACATGMPIEVSASAGLAGPTGYATLKAGFDAINAGVHQNNIAVAVCGDTTELATAALNASGVGPSVYSAVLVAPSNAGARTISGDLAAPLVDLNGADNVTIDGLNAGGNALTFTNTSAAATAGTSTIRFIGGATGNMVVNATLLGSSTTTLATVGGGTVYFADDAVALTGNDNNTISNNNIGPAGSNLPNKAIYGLGSTTDLANGNSGVVINNNRIFDFFNAASSVSGIYVASGNDAWTISNNRIYQTAARTFTSTLLRYSGITLNSTVGTLGAFTLNGNAIGFAAANGTGTTSILGSTNTFRGIDAPSVNATTPTSIQNNTISGINQTTASTGTGTSSQFIGMMLGTVGGRFNVGDTLGNKIGSLDGSSTIVINSTAGTGLVYGMYDFSVSANTFANNAIGSITIQGVGGVNGFRGILLNTGNTLTGTVTGNTVANITNTQVGSYSLYGIQTLLTAAAVTDNVVRNFTGNSNGGVVVMAGINVSAGSSINPSVVARNTVHSMRNTVVGGASGAIYALDFTLPTQANIVERNLVHSISVDTTFVGYQVNGILIRGTSPSTTTFRNNMVRLGFDAAGAPITLPLSFTGIRDSAGTNVANNYYHNSVYIGGSGVVGGTVGNVGSYAFNSDVVTTTRNFQDNIFWNARGNATTGAFHVGARYGGTTVNPAGLTASNNDIYVTGTTGFVGLFNGFVYPDLASFQAATGQDANSFSDDPQFIAPSGSAVTGDLHISPTIATPIEGTGIAIASVTNDFDGQARGGLTPTDVGADAGNFVPQIGNLTITPTSVLFGQVAVGVTSPEMSVVLGNNGTGSLQVTTLTPATSPFARTATGTCSATVPITIAAGGSCTLTYTFSPTTNGPFNQTLTVTANAPGSGTIALSGTGIQGNLSITPTDVPFGNQTVGTTSAAMPVTFTNTGNAALTVTLATPTSPFGTAALVAPEALEGFTNCSASPFALAPGASCSIGYTFSPTATGPFTQMLTATSSGLGGGTITLSGTGVQGALSISPTTIDFGNQSIGTTSGASTVTLSNTGNATLNVTTLTPAATPFARLGGTCGGTPIAITAGGSCTLTYTFSPTAAGAAMQTLTVTSDAPGSGTITLMGNGVQGTLVVSPTTVDFGSPDVFTTTQFMSVTLTNTGTGSLQVNSLTLAAAPFQRTTDGTCGNSLPITIPASGSCTLTYKFAPTTAGVQSQNFTVSNNGSGGSGMFTLTGNGVSDRIFRDGFDGPLPPEAE